MLRAPDDIRERAFYGSIVLLGVLLCLGFWAALGYVLSLQ
jgi:hypothetical protein